MPVQGRNAIFFAKITLWVAKEADRGKANYWNAGGFNEELQVWPIRIRLF